MHARRGGSHLVEELKPYPLLLKMGEIHNRKVSSTVSIAEKPRTPARHWLLYTDDSGICSPSPRQQDQDCWAQTRS